MKKIICFRQNYSSAKKEDSEKVCHKKDVLAEIIRGTGIKL